jgi:KaiC/GvpD/RAD55 family RecA-like ATPase
MVDVKSGDSLLLLIKNTEYQKTIVNILKQFHLHKVCYVTLNKTSESLIELFNKNKLNTKEIVFVDAISKTLLKTRKGKNQYFVKSPSSIEEIYKTVDKLIGMGYTHIVFDSLTNLLVYKNKTEVKKFVMSLIELTAKKDVRILFYALLKHEYENLIKDVSNKVDRIIDYSE